MKYGVVAIHGVGAGTEMDRRGFSLELKKRVFTDLKEAEELWHECVWEGLNSKIDECVGGVVRKLLKDYHIVRKEEKERWWRAVTRVLANFFIDVGGGFVADGLDLGLDFVLYLDSDHGQKIRNDVKQKILTYADKHPQGIVLVAHSLGSVIAYDILAEAYLNGETLPVKRLVTFGSPLNWTFELRKAEQKKELNYTSIGNISWDNFYYVEDCVPLYEHLSKDRFLAVENIPLKLPVSSSQIASHCAYWSDDVLASHVRTHVEYEEG